MGRDGETISAEAFGVLEAGQQLLSRCASESECRRWVVDLFGREVSEPRQWVQTIRLALELVSRAHGPAAFVRERERLVDESRTRMAEDDPSFTSVMVDLGDAYAAAQRTGRAAERQGMSAHHGRQPDEPCV